MSAPPRPLPRRRVVTAIGCVVALVAAVALWWLLFAPPVNRFTAYFTSAVSLFPGSDVRVLGVRVGEIESVTPVGTRVKVVLMVDRATKVPAGAGAVSIAPSLVSDRYVQLTPPYTTGEQLADGAEIPLERTANPLELDELYASLNRLTTALGPQGANKDGALSDLIEVQAQTLDGTGQTINDTINRLSQAARTLSDSRIDLFTTVDNLRTFTSALAASDAQVRQFNDRLAEVSGILAAERADLGESLRQLAIALDEVSRFVADHREVLTANVDKLVQITELLVDQKADLQEFLDVAPLAISDMANAYNAHGGGLEIRLNLNELADPSLLLCKLLSLDSVPPDVLPVLPPDFLAACRTLIGQLGQGLNLPTPADVVAAVQRGELPPIPVLGASQPAAGPNSGPNSGPAPGGGG
jgi:phospholipid/cholesterol/gamma-HCH transport system substrate-binding protein